MNSHERKSLIFRIIQGKINYKIDDIIYTTYSPSLDILSDAQNYYDTIIDDYKYDIWLTKDECISYLIYNGLWHRDDEYKLKQLNEEIEETKVKIFQSFFDTNQTIYLKSILADINTKIINLENILHSLDNFTLDGFADILQEQYILTRTTYIKDKLVFPNIDNAYFNLLNIINYIIHQKSLTHSIYRELARTEPWISYWRIGKEDVFGLNGVQLSNEQKYLILYSKMYDSIYEHQEEPSQDIINDDDALDGWMIIQRQKRDTERNTKTTESAFNLNPNAQEVFLPANNLADIRRIENLNTSASKIIKTQRQAAIRTMGEISESQLPDKKLEIMQKLRN